MDVHLWWRRIEPGDAAVGEAGHLLSADEQTRAAAFRFDDDRRRFVIGRGFLRQVLGAHLETEPAGLCLGREPGGKPRLEGDGAEGLGFSLARRGELVLVGIRERGRIGVDVEEVRALPELDAMAEQIMSPPELAAWRARPEAERDLAFFRIWTRKEALGKAEGSGLSSGPQHLVVPGDVASGRAVPVASLEPARSWLLSDLAADEGYVASVVVEADGPAPEAVSYDDGQVELAERWTPATRCVVRRFATARAPAR